MLNGRLYNIIMFDIYTYCFFTQNSKVACFLLCGKEPIYIATNNKLNKKIIKTRNFQDIVLSHFFEQYYNNDVSRQKTLSLLDTTQTWSKWGCVLPSRLFSIFFILFLKLDLVLLVCIHTDPKCVLHISYIFFSRTGIFSDIFISSFNRKKVFIPVVFIINFLSFLRSTNYVRVMF